MKVTLPEGYIFDILSIYQIKSNKFKENSINISNFRSLFDEIQLELGFAKVQEIMNSQEYQNLLSANQDTFELVDAVKTNPCLGREVDAANYRRFLAKKALQERWFDNSYSEVKIGY